MEAIRPFIAGYHPPADLGGPCLWFICRGGNLLVAQNGAAEPLPRLNSPAQLGLIEEDREFLGFLEEVPCFAVRVAEDTPPPPGYDFKNRWGLYGRLPYHAFMLAGLARQLLDWLAGSRFCGSCGAPNKMREQERARECTACGLVRYPRLSPAIIVQVTRGQEILLARGPHFPPGMYSVLAGFVELGETLEEAVSREVAEETGVRVEEVRYFGSQPWPFPDSLMVGFTARWAGGELRLGDGELEDAGWFTRYAMPKIPSGETIARHLIDDYLSRA